MRGASALDDLLAEFPEAGLRVQVVWEPVLVSDVAAPITNVLRLLDDRRVIQYWDPDRIVSADIVRAVNGAPTRYGFEGALPPGFIAWDVVAVFDATAHWGDDLPVPGYYGGPVVNVMDDTRQSLTERLSGAAK